MIKINKIVLGIRTSSVMFRVTSLAGQIIDEILSNRVKEPLDDKYYSEVGTHLEAGRFSLMNKERGNFLLVDGGNIVFTKDCYEQSNKEVSFRNAIKEFTFVWKIIDSHLKVCDVRRIGIVAEHQVEKDNGSKLLLDSLVNFTAPEHPAKFHLKYEDRRPTAKGNAPDINKSDFTNIIYNFYDSEIDIDHPTPDAVNFNVDLQRYFSPLLSSNISNEIIGLSKMFESEEREFIKLLKAKEMI
jgi:hypothetical protein